LGVTEKVVCSTLFKLASSHDDVIVEKKRPENHPKIGHGNYSEANSKLIKRI